MITFITGGSRSGKSSLALSIAKNSKNKKVLFIATYINDTSDKEMIERIRKHKKVRPQDWDTLELKDNLKDAVKKIKKYDCIIIDCMTMYVSKEVMNRKRENTIVKDIKYFLKTVKSLDKKCIIVSNEVGMGVIPGDRLSRIFRDAAGRANQVTARLADEVYLCVSGINVNIKRLKES